MAFNPEDLITYDELAPSLQAFFKNNYAAKVHSHTINEISDISITAGSTFSGKIYVGASAPSNPGTGLIWIDITNSLIKRWTGSSWFIFGAAYQ